MSNLNKLLAKAAKKDQSAFHALYQETSPRLLALSLRLMNYDNEAAEEVLQEAFIKIWNKADKYNSENGSAMAWMGTIVRNQSFDRLRSYKSRVELVEEGDFEGIEYAAKDLQPEQQSFQKQQLSVFKEMLNAMPAQIQAVMTQSLVNGYSHSEIAENMQLPLGTIKSWLRRGLKDVQAVMADKDAFGY